MFLCVTLRVTQYQGDNDAAGATLHRATARNGRSESTLPYPTIAIEVSPEHRTNSAPVLR